MGALDATLQPTARTRVQDNTGALETEPLTRAITDTKCMEAVSLLATALIVGTEMCLVVDVSVTNC